MTLAPEAPYPACVQDANYAVRWLKSKAATWNGDASKVGIYGSSSGGHVAELLAMRPRDPRYNAIPLAARRRTSMRRVAYVAMRSPISDPFARFENAEQLQARADDQEPQDVLQAVGHDPRKQPAGDPRAPARRSTLVPLLIMQGALDDNVLPAMQEKFAKTYKAAGGDVRVSAVRGLRARMGRRARAADRPAREMVKAFIARQLKGVSAGFWSCTTCSSLYIFADIKRSRFDLDGAAASHVRYVSRRV